MPVMDTRIIAVEEHFADRALMAASPEAGWPRDPALPARLVDVSEQRLAAMDADGIDVQLIGHGSPST